MARVIKSRTALEALKEWDEGKILPSISLGGIGPGYEQAIQLLVFELIRDNYTTALPLTGEECFEWGGATVTRCEDGCGGLSMAQVGQAKWLALRALRLGWDGAIKDTPVERAILVSNKWPHV